MDDIAINSEAPGTTSQFSSATRIICRVCQKQFSQYTCPRCNTRYCALPCYKSHSLRCTESFMKDNVMGELQQLQSNDENKRKMLDILKRVHEEEVTEDMDENDSESEADSILSEATIQKILSGSQLDIQDLTPEEQKHFQRAIASGELSKLIQPWEPWWLKPSAKNISLGRDGSQLVQPLVRENNVEEGDQVDDVPAGSETPLPPLKKLSAADPSPLLPFHLIDIIYSYCFTLRLYNGDWLTNATGAALVCLTISSVLDQNGHPETVMQALTYCVEESCSPAFRHMGGSIFAFQLMDDVSNILNLGRAALVCLLCDLQRMIEAAKREVKSEKLTKSRKMEVKDKLKLAERKVQFLMCWVNEQPEQVWSSLAALVLSEKSSVVEHFSNKGRAKLEKVGKTKGKPVIQEIK